MSESTTSWFASPDQVERKAVVCMLFEVRSHQAVTQSRYARLFDGLLAHLDDEYHALKG